MIQTQIQPQFAPIFHDLASMLKADQVIFLDEDTWSRKGRTHRAMITQSEWINIPIRAHDKKKSIKNVRIDHSVDWFTPFWNGIYHTFHSFPYFDYFEDELKAVFEDVRSSTFLIDFNLMVLNKILRWLELNITYQLASEVTYELNKKTIIYQEYKSKNYIHRLEDSECVKIKHPTISAIAELSILHLLFLHGPESFKLFDLL